MRGRRVSAWRNRSRRTRASPASLQTWTRCLISLIAAYVVGYAETLTAYLLAPTLRPIPALLILILVLYIRPRGFLGRR